MSETVSDSEIETCERMNWTTKVQRCDPTRSSPLKTGFRFVVMLLDEGSRQREVLWIPASALGSHFAVKEVDVQEHNDQVVERPKVFSLTGKPDRSLSEIDFSLGHGPPSLIPKGSGGYKSSRILGCWVALCKQECFVASADQWSDTPHQEKPLAVEVRPCY
jgi:hypothetical protein